ncbi:LLM class F420-dependent oxidoreductase [Streptomyces roseirectus]|uniref:LLM class F420-dependent oxidoreductase n=1 Tax=Streptomyces roseirectus TaxID=2768066 RepID=A0A7H0IEV8_9ACTN|nr:LLM class F420-dependent oxidoreductase [Streptomyces roseirectus]QNP71324.1 LLM class F420-dependent oxidoreductase [Streptomyces roseirectus]
MTTNSNPAPLSLGTYGVWRFGSSSPELAVELEALGFSALWLGNPSVSEFDGIERMLDATETLVVATGIVNIWANPAQEVARGYHRIVERHPDRFLLGVGAGHRENTQEYTRPYQALNDYLDVLDEAEVPVSRRVLAALGPRVTRLSMERAVGAHPYLVPPEHTRRAREILGEGPLLVTEQKVVVDPDPVRARELAVESVGVYLGLSNYTNNLRKLGYSDEDFVAPGSDRLLGDLVTQGGPEAAAAGLRAHAEAGADHVVAQVLGAGEGAEGYRKLAEALALK